MSAGWPRVGTLAFATALAVAGCLNTAEPGARDGETTPSASPTSAAPSSPPTTTTPTPTRSTRSPTRTPTPSPTPERPITIAFAGDVHFEGELRDRLSDPADALGPIAAEVSAADLTVVNLETTIATGGSPEPGKRYTFRAPPSALTALAAAGLDVASMANNHAMDFGPDALRESLAAAKDSAVGNPPLEVVGIGTDVAEAFAPARLDVRGVSVAVLAASMADDPTADPTAHWAAGPERAGVATVGDDNRLVEAVRAERQRTDLVVVYLHWGVQGESCPSESQSDLARRLADAGADIIVGSHAHRLQGAGFLDGAFVAYGLGNFVWYTQGEPTGLLTLTATAGEVSEAEWAPAHIAPDGLPRFAAGDEADRLRREFAALRECTNLRR